MDDADDRAYARAPELEDLVGLCRALNSAGVRYVLIGGFAVILHGFVRTTKDIDLLVDPSADNVRAVRLALAACPTTRRPNSRTTTWTGTASSASPMRSSSI